MNKTKPIKITVNSIPKQIELFGRTIKTLDDTIVLNVKKCYGEARYGTNEIALSKLVNGGEVSDEENKCTYIHEMLHFILNFTGYQSIIENGGKIELEQFIELLSAGIYQYEKSAQY
jgi:hypothetical protein